MYILLIKYFDSKINLMFDYRYLIDKTSTMSENEGTTIGNLIYCYIVWYL